MKEIIELKELHDYLNCAAFEKFLEEEIEEIVVKDKVIKRFRKDFVCSERGHAPLCGFCQFCGFKI